MKQDLKTIYRDLADRRISKAQALERIRALKSGAAAAMTDTGTLFAAPEWEPAAIPAAADAPGYAQRQIAVYGFPSIDARQIESRIPDSRCRSLAAEPGEDQGRAFLDAALSCFGLVKSGMESKSPGKTLFQLVVSSDPEQSVFIGLSGLLKSAALENPRFMGQVILADADSPVDTLAALLQREAAWSRDAVVKYENGGRTRLEWKESHALPERDALSFKDNGVYLITGGLGGLGTLCAGEILRQTDQAKIILVGRSPLSETKKGVLRQLNSKRGLVDYRKLDISEMDELNRFMGEVQLKYGGLNGIIHGAGLNLDNFILKKTAAEFEAVLRPKVQGTCNLDRASRGFDLDFFAMFSSLAACFGNVGQADYAAANGFMDHFAGYRNGLREKDLRQGMALSINWPYWQEGGMALDPATRDSMEKDFGLRAIDTAAGLSVFHRCLQGRLGQVLVLPGDLPRIRKSLLAGGAARQSFSGQRETVALGTAATGAVRARPGAADPGELLGKTQEYLCLELAGMLTMSSHKIDPHAPLEKYGIDSIMAMNLTNQLEKTFGSLSKTLFFEYRSLHELARYFAEFHREKMGELFGAPLHTPPQEAASGGKPAPAPTQSRIPYGSRLERRSPPAPVKPAGLEPIAIIGLSGRFPESPDIQAFWENLRDGKDCVTEVPKERWDWREHYSQDRSKTGAHYSKWGGFIAGVDEFDPRFFNISPREAESIDPQERLFLQHAWMGVEDAGYTRESLQIPQDNDLPGQVGVYAGVMYGEYNVSGSLAGIANRVSYVLNLHGPSLVVDTMCSSSLTAIHLACEDLKRGRTQLGIAGGVNVSVHPNKYRMLSAGQFISGAGQCQSFGEGGDGYIPGEGVGVVVLKRLADAVRDGNHIYGIIKGSALNHGGKTNGSAVPNPQAQTAAITRALAESGTHPRQVGYIEAHGTGTKLGDPIEIAALTKAFRRQTAETQYCLIGSAKSNIGHCESAAGIAGLAKVLLQLKHRQIVPSLHSARLNPHIEFTKTPFIVNQVLRAWEQPVIEGKPCPRIAGLSSFGAGGSNAHLIVQEYIGPEEERFPGAAPGANFAIPLSARTQAQLKQKAKDLLAFIQRSSRRLPEAPALDALSMAYTLQVGREAMEERLGFLVDSVEQLEDRLLAYVGDSGNLENTYAGRVDRDKDTLSLFNSDADFQQTLERWIAQKKLPKLLELWTKGLKLDWNRLYDDARPGFMSLPAYPFAKERYWIDPVGRAISGAGKNGPAAAAAASIHPFLHANTSTLELHGYSSVFTGEEAFLTKGPSMPSGQPSQKFFSAGACLEMIRAAVEAAANPQAEPGMLELQNTAWDRPIAIAGGKPLRIALVPDPEGRIGYEIYSGGNADEMIHCQGRAAFRPLPAWPKLDVGAMRGSPATIKVEDDQNGFVFHPAISDAALQAAKALLGDSAAMPLRTFPSSIDLVRMSSVCAKEMYALARISQNGSAGEGPVKMDVDLCDKEGIVRAQFRGIAFHAADVQAPAMQRETADINPDTAAPAKMDLHKPTGISLDGIEAMEIGAVSRAKTPVSLLNPASVLDAGERRESLPASARLEDLGAGIFSLRVSADDGDASLTPEAAGELLRALAFAEGEATLKALILTGTDQVFLRGEADRSDPALGSLFHALAAFPFPIIGAAQGDATGMGFLVAALCDFMVCGSTARYGFTNPDTGFCPNEAVAAFFNERFGESLSGDFLYASFSLTGLQMREKGWTCPVLPADQVEARARAIALSLAQKPGRSLRLLKRNLNRHLFRLARDLAANENVAAETRYDPSASIGQGISHGKHVLALSHGEDIVEFTIPETLREQGVIDAMLADLASLFAQAKESGRHKAIVLSSAFPGFLPGESMTMEAVREFQRIVLDSALPVVTLLDTGAEGAAWLLGLFCDAAIYCGGVSYRGAPWSNPEMAGQAALLFPHRLGGYPGREAVLTGKTYPAEALRKGCGVLRVAEKDQGLAVALRIAGAWAKLPLAVLEAWKKRSSAILRDKLALLPQGSDPAGGEAPPDSGEPAAIALRSRAVTATSHPGGILVVKMEDREAKNMFSRDLESGLKEAFEHVERAAGCKAVVLTGYDGYFASGGTKETLLDIHQGKMKFTDNKIYQMALSCEVPVIAAMQGHGIGAGWALGMFADFPLFSEEGRFYSPYMNYGFTPGAGATLVFPERTGYDLAKETLLMAQEQSGGELKARGLAMPVMPRREVLPAAMELAQRVAENSRAELIALKWILNRDLRQRLADTYALELAMHEETFVGQSGTLERIESNFITEDARWTAEPGPAAEPQDDEARNSGPARPNDLPAFKDSLKAMLAQELYLEESEIAEDRQFIDLGLDSITGVTWIRRINEKYRTNIDATKIYRFPTLDQLSRYVKEEVEKSTPADPERKHPAAPAAAIPPAAAPRAIATSPTRVLTSLRKRKGFQSAAATSVYRPQPIAVIGMAGQFPKANNLDEYWRNLSQGRNCISEIPQKRWDVNAYYQKGEAAAGKTYSKWMGVLDEYDLFDPLFFNISPAEAKSMDPQQRVFLQACWQAIEDAGCNAKILSGSKCGVFVGCANGDYHQLSENKHLSAHDFTGGSISILAARISYFLNLQGPCVTLDTACSSSLVAIANACDSLVSGSSDMALAGGVYLGAGPAMHIMTSQAGMLSPDGRCFSFDQRANGFVPGEGVGVVMLKRLADAERDQDRILGVVQGWGVNQDGKTNGITAPNAESQTRLQQEVYGKFGINPEHIQMVEAHGTGTKLGDPIEVEGLKESFRKYTEKPEYCALGSVKSNIGHCLTAAGVAGFIKVLLSLRHKQVPPTINYERLNEHVSLQGSPFYINDRLRAWNPPASVPRQAAVSAFGFSGTNAHVVVGEHLAAGASKRPVAAATQNGKAIVPLSARTPEQLLQKARDLSDFLRREGASLDLTEVAYTLQVGREAMAERLGFMVGSIGQLAERLDAYIGGEKGIPDAYHGQPRRNKEEISILSQDEEMKATILDKWISEGKLSKLLDLWVKGVEFDWRRLYGEVKPRRLSLPVYPFSKERYWIDSEDAFSATDNGLLTLAGKSPVLHALLHANTSDFTQHSYRSTFTGRELLFADHRVKGKKMLPALGHLEMALEAVKHAAGKHRRDGQSIRLKDVFWDRPVVVGEKSLEVDIGLSPWENGTIEYEIHSAGPAAGEDAVHSHGTAQLAMFEDSLIDLAEIQKKDEPISLNAEEGLEFFHAQGLPYKPAYQGADKIYVGDNELLVKLTLSASAKKAASEGLQGRTALHVSILDSVLQASVGMIFATKMNAAMPSCRQPRRAFQYRPFALESLEVRNDSPEPAWALVRYLQGGTNPPDAPKVDIDLLDDAGRALMRLKGFAFEYLQDDLTHLLLETDKTWFSLTEQWVDSPLEIEKDSWFGKIQAKQGHGIMVISEDPKDFETMQDFCRKIGKISKSDQDIWRIHYLPLRRVPGWGLSEPEIKACLADPASIQTVFLFPPREIKDASAHADAEIAYTCVRNLIRLASRQAVRFYCCHEDGPSERSLYQEGLSGLFKSAMLECPEHRYRSIAYDGQMAADGMVAIRAMEEWLCDETLQINASKVPMVRYSKGSRLELRSSRFKVREPLTHPVAFREGATYLMVGALGQVGESICQELGRRYKAKLVVFSRRPICEVKESIAKIESSGATVVYRSVDILDLEALRAAMDQLHAEDVVLHGVIHMARRVSDAPIADKDFREFSSTMAAKVQGTLNIDAVTAAEPLELFLVFSSMAAFGIKGSSDYAFSTAFQNAFARLRNEWWGQGLRSGRTLAVCWGQWEMDGGVDQEKMPARLKRLKSMGIDTIDTPSAMLLMEVGLQSKSDVVGFVAVCNMEAACKSLGFDDESSAGAVKLYSTIEAFEKGQISRRAFTDFLGALDEEELTEAIQNRIVLAIRRNGKERGRTGGKGFFQPAAAPETLLGRSVKGAGAEGAGENESREPDLPAIAGKIIRNLGKVLGLKKEDIEMDKPFPDYGLDSITAVQLATALEKDFARSFAPNWLVEYPTVSSLAGKMKQPGQVPEPA